MRVICAQTKTKKISLQVRRENTQNECKTLRQGKETPIQSVIMEKIRIWEDGPRKKNRNLQMVRFLFFWSKLNL